MGVGVAVGVWLVDDVDEAVHAVGVEFMEPAIAAITARTTNAAAAQNHGRCQMGLLPALHLLAAAPPPSGSLQG